MDDFNLQNQDNEKLDLPSELLVLKVERQVIIQGFAPGNQKIQIQKITALACFKNHIESKLLFSYGIPTHPKSLEGEDQKFMLIFEKLPEDCTNFNLQSVPESGCWISYDFIRNDEDVYYLTII